MTSENVFWTIQNFDFSLLLTNNAYILLCIHRECFWIRRLLLSLYLTNRIKFNSLTLLISSCKCSEIWRAKRKKSRFSTLQRHSSIRLLVEIVWRANSVMRFENAFSTIQKCNIPYVVSRSKSDIRWHSNLLNCSFLKSQRRSWLLWSENDVLRRNNVE